MNKILDGHFYYVPNELYPFISTGIPSDAPANSLRDSKDLLERLETLLDVARTSKWMFTQSMKGLHKHSILKRLVSQDETERSSYDFHTALKPVVECVRMLRPYCDGNIPTNNSFHIFEKISWQLSPNFTKTVNIVRDIPRALYEIFLQQRSTSIDESTISICDEEFERRDEGHYLTSCMEAVKSFEELEIPSNDKIVRAIRYHDGNFLQLPEHHRSTRAYALAAVEHELCDNEEEKEDIQDAFITALTPELKANKEFALKVVARNGWFLNQFPEFQNDEEVVLAAVRHCGTSLDDAAVDVRGNRNIVLAAVQQNGMALEFASDALKDDRDVVLTAIQQNGEALRFASDALKDDRDVVLTAIQQNGEALQFASGRLLNDKDFIVLAINNKAPVWACAPKELLDDKDVVLAMVKTSGPALYHAPQTLRDDKDVVLAAVQNYGLALQHASLRLRNDEDVVFAAIKQDYNSAQYIGAPLLYNNAFLIQLKAKDLRCLPILQQLWQTIQYLQSRARHMNTPSARNANY